MMHVCRFEGCDDACVEGVCVGGRGVMIHVYRGEGVMIHVCRWEGVMMHVWEGCDDTCVYMCVSGRSVTVQVCKRVSGATGVGGRGIIVLVCTCV